MDNEVVFSAPINFNIPIEHQELADGQKRFVVEEQISHKVKFRIVQQYGEHDSDSEQLMEFARLIIELREAYSTGDITEEIDSRLEGTEYEYEFNVEPASLIMNPVSTLYFLEAFIAQTGRFPNQGEL